MSVLVKDDIVYNLREQENELSFEQMVKEHSNQIFGRDTLYFDIKEEIKSKVGTRSKPDGYAISFHEENWYLIEIELHTHNPYTHILPQIKRFKAGLENPETQKGILKTVYSKIMENPPIKTHIEEVLKKKKDEEIHHFLTELLQKPPTTIIIVDEKTEKSPFEEVCKELEATIVEFKTFAAGVGFNVHAHLISNPVIQEENARFNEKDKRFTCLMCEKPEPIYSAIGIVEHLEEKHNIDNKDQIIDGWNDIFQKMVDEHVKEQKRREEKRKQVHSEK